MRAVIDLKKTMSVTYPRKFENLTGGDEVTDASNGVNYSSRAEVLQALAQTVHINFNRVRSEIGREAKNLILYHPL